MVKKCNKKHLILIADGFFLFWDLLPIRGKKEENLDHLLTQLDSEVFSEVTSVSN